LNPDAVVGLGSQSDQGVVIAQESLARDGGSHAAAAFAPIEAGVRKAGCAVENAEDIVIHDQIVFVVGTGTLLQNVLHFYDVFLLHVFICESIRRHLSKRKTRCFRKVAIGIAYRRLFSDTKKAGLRIDSFNASLSFAFLQQIGRVVDFALFITLRTSSHLPRRITISNIHLGKAHCETK